jgi:signal transduction histidine kinase
MAYMGTASSRRARWAGGRGRIAASPHAPLVVAALLGVAAVTEALTRAAGTSVGGSPLVLSLLAVAILALATTLPLGFFWAQPGAAAIAVSAASLLSLGVFQIFTVAGLLGQLTVLYRLGRHGSQQAGLRFLAAGLTAPFLVLALAVPHSGGSEERILTVLLASLTPAAALAGIAVAARSEALVHSAARQAIAGTLMDHTARGERARIARELHDVVAHHISMIAVQAETARLATPGMPAAGAQRLSEIGDTARAGLTEMRRLLGVLREDAQAAMPGDQGTDRQPQPGLRQLNELLDGARDASGAGARLIVSGPPATLDPGVELAAFRIIQEALTNARRHAPGAAIDVELHFTDDVLRLHVRDNGPGPPAAPLAGGHGLAGMRERAAAAGGELRTGPAPGGGFLIEATLPAKAEAAL